MHPQYENRPLVHFEESVANWTWTIHLLLPMHQHWRHLLRVTEEPSSSSTQLRLYYPKSTPNARVHPSFEDRPPRPKPTKDAANREFSTRVQRKVHHISRHSPIKRSIVRNACRRRKHGTHSILPDEVGFPIDYLGLPCRHEQWAPRVFLPSVPLVPPP